MSEETHGILSGLKVVEFSQNAAVPQCGRLLAGMGAEVVKVEPPAGDSMRHVTKVTEAESRTYTAINSGKRGIVLDMLAGDDSRRVVDALLGWADVCLVGLKQGDLVRFGLDWEHVSAVNPRLVHMVLTAFGPLGPDAAEGGYDVLVQGLSGLGFSMNRESAGVPEPTRPAIFDFSSGMMATVGVLAALIDRQRTGKGQRVDASLLGTAVNLGVPVLTTYDRDRDRVNSVLDQLGDLRAEGADFATQRQFYETRLARGASAFALYFRHYLTRDGVLSVAAMSATLYEKFHAVTGLPSIHGLDANSAEFKAIVAEAEVLFETRTTTEWMKELRAVGFPCGRYNTPFEAVDDPQIRANDYVVELEHPVIGSYATAGMPISFSETPAGITATSPRLGEHTAQVLADVGLTASEIADLHQKGVTAPLI
jgi:crotonobetainyl-CoA:carnitine CoA-transferase CaiB-like acyl-CoA transferase